MDTLPSYTLLDGATATNLFPNEKEFNFCIEEYILANPQKLIDLQTEFVNAGSEIILAPTFSANRQLLSRFNLGDQTARINRELVALTKSVEGDFKVAGNLSTTGITIFPYTQTPFESLVEIYREQARALDSAGVDLFIIETMSSLAEARAAVFACREFKKPIFVTFTINEKGKTIYRATPLNCLISLQDLGISAFGINCSCGPLSIAPFIKELSAFSKIPIIAKPNNINNLPPIDMAAEMSTLLDGGATIIGGCCGTTPAHIAEMQGLINQYKTQLDAKTPMQSNDIILASDKHTFSLDNDRIDFSDPIICEHDMADIFMNIEDDSLDVMLIQIDTVDDAMMFIVNAHLANLPVCFHATNETALEVVLRQYNGKAMVDEKSPIELEPLTAIAQKYGAVVY